MHTKTLKVLNFVEDMLKENGSNYKKATLVNYVHDNDIQVFLQQLLDKRISYGIQSKKYDKVEESLQNEFNGKSIIDVMLYLHENNSGTNDIVSKVKAFVNSHEESVQETLKLIIQKDINLGFSAKTVNDVYGGELVYELTLMKSTAFDKVLAEYAGVDVVSTIKMDGIRLTVLNEKGNQQLMLRSGHLAEGMEHIAEVYKNVPEGMYDGEVIIKDREGKDSRQVRQETNSIVRNADADKTQLEHIIFDGVTKEEFDNRYSDMPYKERRKRLREIVNATDGIKLSEKVYEGNEFEKQWDKLLDEYVAKGEEGLMVIKSNAPYVFKQTKEMAKIKKSYPIDLRVIDVYEGKKASTKGVMGGAVVEYKGNKVYVGGGWTKEQREHYWSHPDELIGKIIEIRHDGETQNKATGLYSISYPRFMYLRDDKDDESLE